MKWDGAKQTPRATQGMEGLSLIEVAIALAVSALLLGGLMVPLAAQIDRYRVRETEAALGQALEALLGYAAAHGNRLPCPDIDGGREGRPARLGGGPLPRHRGRASACDAGGSGPGRMGAAPSLPGQRRPHRTGRRATAAEHPGPPSDRQPAYLRTPDGRRSRGAGRNPLLVRRQRPSGRRERRDRGPRRRLLQSPSPRSPLCPCGAGPPRVRRIRRPPRVDVEERASRPAGTGGNLAVSETRTLRTPRTPVRSAAVRAARVPWPPTTA